MEKFYRKSAETEVSFLIDFSQNAKPRIDIPLPFLAHLLNAMAWHGGFYIECIGQGDVDVDPHHLVEDIGIVFGKVLSQFLNTGSYARYGVSKIPMDEALSEVVVDACKRAFLVYRAEYPQSYCGNFQIALLREFFYALAHNAGITLHCISHYGENSHHIAESLFKALGRAIKIAFTKTEGSQASMSTKEML